MLSNEFLSETDVLEFETRYPEATAFLRHRRLHREWLYLNGRGKDGRKLISPAAESRFQELDAMFGGA